MPERLHRKRTRTIVLQCSILALGAVLLAPTMALAARGHRFERSFSEPCTSEPCAGALKEPYGIAINEATGEVYVADAPANRVARFAAGGEFLSEFNGSGTLPGEGASAGALGRPGEVSTGRFSEPQTIAVDNSCVLRALSAAQCEEADPSAGDVYVVDAGHRVVDKYSASGEYLGQISGAESRFERAVDGVAVDSQGVVWVYLEDRTISGYTDGAVNAFLTRTLPVNTAAFAAPGFAVDGEGDFYLRYALEVGRIAKVSPSGHVLIGALDGEPSTGIATDPAAGEAFVDNAGTIAVFDSAGTLVERLGEEEGSSHLVSGAGLAVDARAGALYVADAATDRVVVFGPSPPSTPTVQEESFAGVSATGALLSAKIDPRSESGEAPSEYRFEYGRCPTLAGCAESGYEASVPMPDGRLEPDFELHEVSAEATGLTPGTNYHFRVLVRNSHGEGEAGAEQSFTTKPAPATFTLPDDRGWELVSPPEKQGSQIEPISESGVVEAAADGGAITYLADAPTEADPEGYANGVQVLSRRGPAAWSSRDVSIPHSGATGVPGTGGPEYKLFDPDLELGAVQPLGEFIPQLSEEASESTAYLHDLSGACGTDCYRPLVTGKPGFANVAPGTVFGEEQECTPRAGHISVVVCGPEVLGASEDLSHVVLRSTVALEPGAAPGGLYEWSAGRLAPLSVLPDGQAAPEGTALGLSTGGDSQAARRAISADGSRVVWSSATSLYLRDTVRGETVQLDGAQAGCATCSSGGGSFQIASADGSRVLFTDGKRLSEASSRAGEDLYECRIVITGKGRLGCSLSDLTPARGGESAEVQGGVLGASRDGAYVYFVADGVLSEGPNERGQSALAGQPNLYLRHEGTTRFIATLSQGDSTDWSEELIQQPTRVSESGRFLELMSQASPTGYDNRDIATGAPVAEVYLFDAESGRLECVSCEPTGERPTGVEFAKLEPGSGGLVGGPRGAWLRNELVAANVPGWTAIGTGGKLKERYQPRYLLEDGRLFFDSADALVPEDVNAIEDVYEYEPPGVGDCSEASRSFSERSGGCVALISSGGSERESAFMDASESGGDVYFLTAARLSALDEDSLLDLYDAHVCTDSAPCISFAGAPVPPCASEGSCRPPPAPQPATAGIAPTATLAGATEQLPLPPSSGPGSKALTRAQKLAGALKACRARRRGRKACERKARKRFGAVRRASKTAKRKHAPGRGRARGRR